MDAPAPSTADKPTTQRVFNISGNPRVTTNDQLPYQFIPVVSPSHPNGLDFVMAPNPNHPSNDKKKSDQPEAKRPRNA